MDDDDMRGFQAERDRLAMDPERFRADLASAEEHTARGFMAPVAFSRALLDIVEALAAEPDIVRWDNPERCAFCGNWTFEHAEKCIHRQARVLVGPASERTGAE